MTSIVMKIFAVLGQVQAALDKLWSAQDIADACSPAIPELIEEAATILQKVKIT